VPEQLISVLEALMDKSCGAPDTEVPEVSVPSTKADTHSWNLRRELAIINIIVYAHNRHLTGYEPGRYRADSLVVENFHFSYVVRVRVPRDAQTFQALFDLLPRIIEK